MASTDAKPVPKKNVAYRVTFPIYTSTDTLQSAAADLDSEVDKDGGGFADCTNEATEIGSSGVYYLDLTATEMNADTVTVLVKTSTSGAKTPLLIMYPEETGDIRADVTSISGDATAADNAEAVFDNTGYNMSNSTIGAGGTVDANVVSISGDATAADNAEAFFDGTGYAGTNNVIPLVTTVQSIEKYELTVYPDSVSGDTFVLQVGDDNLIVDDNDIAGWTVRPIRYEGVGSTPFGQTRTIVSYNADTRTVTLDSAFSPQIDTDTVIRITPFGSSASGTVDANVVSISGDATAADNAESFFDGTGYAGTNNVIPTVTDLTNPPTIEAPTAADVADAVWDEALAGHVAAGSAGEAIGDTLKTGDSVTLANDSITAAAFAADALAEIKAEVEAVMASTTRAELSAVPAANAPLADKLTWITMLLRNKRTQDEDTETVFADNAATEIATSSKTVSSGTMTRGAYTDVP